MIRRGIVIGMCVVAFGLIYLARIADAVEDSEIYILRRNVSQLYSEGRFDEAYDLANRYEAIAGRAEREGSKSQYRMIEEAGLEVATAVSWICLILEAQGRHEEIDKWLPIIDHGREYERRLFEDDTTGQLAANLAELSRLQGRFSDAEQIYDTVFGLFDGSTLGPNPPNLANRLNNLATLATTAGRIQDTVKLLEHSLQTQEREPKASILLFDTLEQLGAAYYAAGLYSNAEATLKRYLVRANDDVQLKSSETARATALLAALFQAQGRFGEAEQLYRRSMLIGETLLSTDGSAYAESINGLGSILVSQGKYDVAEQQYKAAISIFEQSGNNEQEALNSLSNLAAMYQTMGRLEEAKSLYNNVLERTKVQAGERDPLVASTLNNLSLVHLADDKPSEAERLLKNAIAIDDALLGPSHPTLGSMLNNLGWSYLVQEKWDDALEALRKAVDIYQKKLLVETADYTQDSDIRRRGSLAISGDVFRNFIQAAFRTYLQDESARYDLLNESLIVAQLAHRSDAGASLEKMAERGKRAEPDLRLIVRERQELVREWQAKDAALVTLRSKRAGANGNSKTVEALSSRLAAIDGRIGYLNTVLNRDFPNYASFQGSGPLTVGKIQENLATDEAVVVFLSAAELKPLPGETFIWVVTKTESRWVRSERGIKAEEDSVAALRCGLDGSAWRGEGHARCAAALGLDAKAQAPSPLPFDTAKARELYTGLFGDVVDLLINTDGTGKSLLIVPSGALTALPFQVLVTDDEASDTPGQTPTVSWLIRRHAITVLPSVASLAALRRDTEEDAGATATSDTRDPFIGFGNPLLTGSGHCGKIVVPATCPDSEIQLASTASISVARDPGDEGALDEFFRNGLADVAAVKTRLCPLPDTAHELTCVARSLGAPDSSVILGGDMTETKLKAMSLDHVRVIHFATHGLLAGETSQLANSLAEPSLVMSPPDTPTDLDDGLLTASEVAALKLNADWVVMSACNTAGASTPGAEALSGLAKAFFYAGARALLVSHWPVNSYAATMLTSRTFAELKANPAIGRSEALRRAMLAVMSDKTRPGDAHPSVWAPFVVVGEGGAGR